MGKKGFHDYLKKIDAMYVGREWLSDTYSVLDPYAFVFFYLGRQARAAHERAEGLYGVEGPHDEAPGRAARGADEGVKL